MADNHEDEKPKKIKRRRGNILERWEVALVEAMIERGHYSDQDILAYFTRPTRSLNGRTIHEIHIGKKHKATKAADPEELDAFLATWPDVDHETGLSARGDELLNRKMFAVMALSRHQPRAPVPRSGLVPPPFASKHANGLQPLFASTYRS